MTSNATHDRLVLALLKRKHATPHMPIAPAAISAMRGQLWPLEQLALVLDVAIEYLDSQLSIAGSVPAFIERLETEIAFQELVGGLHTPAGSITYPEES